SALDVINRQLEQAKKINDEILKTGTYQKEKSYVAHGGGVTKVSYATQKEILDAQNNYKDLLEQQTKLQRDINLLSGDYLNIEGNAVAVKNQSTDATKKQVETLETLKAKLKELEDAREHIAITDKKALDNNLQQITDLQKKINDLEGKDTPISSGERKIESLIKDAKDFKKEMDQLQKDAQTKDASELQQQLAMAGDKYQKLIEKAQDYYTKLAGMHGLEAEALKKAFAGYIRDLGIMEDAELEKTSHNYFKSLQDKFYSQDKTAINQRYDDKEQQAKQQYLDNEITKEQLIATLQQQRIEKLQALMQLTQQYAALSRQAAQDMADAEKQATDAQVAGKDDKIEREIEKLKDAKPSLQLATGASQKPDDHHAMLLKMIETYKQYGSAMLNFFSAVDKIISAGEQRRLQRAESGYNKEKAALDKQLKNKLLSESRYEKKLQELQEKKDKEEAEIKRKQAKRQKALSIFQIAVNTAQAVMETFAQFGWPAGILPAAVVGGIGIAEGAAVAAEPLPSLGEGGLIDNGPKHKDKEKGLYVVDPRTGKTEMLLEQGEGVVNAAAMNADQSFTVTGTPKQIASKINSLYGGYNFADGAVATLAPNWRLATPSINTDAVIKSYGAGGAISTTSSPVQSSSDLANNEVAVLTAEVKGMRSDIASWNTKLKAFIVYRELQDSQRLYDLSQKTSALNQNK
ncbi:MAG TPA: hypothetical protein PL045_03615, partial [Chitinophagaceae bacterium]|nr:hypothetical protein [Chitinophagaceae bacterium]